MKKKIKISIIFGIFLAMFSLTNLVYAQSVSSDIIAGENNLELNVEAERATIIATVNIYDAKIVSQSQNKIKINFNIHNDKNVQPGIRYGIQLFKQKSGNDIMIHQWMADDILNLGENKGITKNFIYEAPNFLNGEYHLRLVSYNQEGLMLAMWFFNEPIVLSGNGKYIEIKDCYIHVQGEEDTSRYQLQSGVDIINGEQLEVVCEAENRFQKDVSVIIKYDTFERSIFSGRKVDERMNQDLNFDFKSQQKKVISFPLFQLDLPQAYDVRITLVDSQNDNLVSNSIVTHYVVQGESATIQGVRLNNDQYKAGDIAQLFFVLSGSAGNFSNARHKGFTSDLNILEIILKNNNGEICSQNTTNIKNIEEIPVVKIDLPIKKDCVDPHVYIKLKNKDGKILYQTNMEITTTTPVKVRADVSEGSSPVTIIFISIGIILLLILILFFLKRKGVNMVIIGIVFGVVFFSSYTNKAFANTYFYHLHHIITVVNWPPPGNYSVGSEVSVQASIPYILSCNNRIFITTQVKCGINSDEKTVIKELDCNKYGACHANSLSTETFTIPSDCGANELSCELNIYSYNPKVESEEDAMWSVIDINYSDTVKALSLGTVPCPPANGACGNKPAQRNGTYTVSETNWPTGSNWCLSGNPPVAPDFPNPGQTVTWNCVGSNGGTTANCLAKRNVGAPTPDLKINSSDGPITNVPVGGNLNLTWPAVANATSCSANGAGWGGNKSPAGGNNTVAASTTSTYTLSCTGPGGTGIDSVQVNICTPNYSYTCVQTNNEATYCANHCGEPFVQTNNCLVADTNSCLGPNPITGFKDASVCATNGTPCQASESAVSCPACPNESNWIEVLP